MLRIFRTLGFHLLKWQGAQHSCSFVLSSCLVLGTFMLMYYKLDSLDNKMERKNERKKK